VGREEMMGMLAAAKCGQKEIILQNGKVVYILILLRKSLTIDGVTTSVFEPALSDGHLC
jgi:hypothetical protein